MSKHEHPLRYQIHTLPYLVPHARKARLLPLLSSCVKVGTTSALTDPFIATYCAPYEKGTFVAPSLTLCQNRNIVCGTRSTHCHMLCPLEKGTFVAPSLICVKVGTSFALTDPLIGSSCTHVKRARFVAPSLMLFQTTATHFHLFCPI